jgi:hypothetical protein
VEKREDIYFSAVSVPTSGNKFMPMIRLGNAVVWMGTTEITDNADRAVDVARNHLYETLIALLRTTVAA